METPPMTEEELRGYRRAWLEAASDADLQVIRMKAEGYGEDGIAIMEAHRDRLRARANGEG